MRYNIVLLHLSCPLGGVYENEKSLVIRHVVEQICSRLSEVPCCVIFKIHFPFSLQLFLTNCLFLYVIVPQFC